MPISIVIAGIIIAGAVYFSNSNKINNTPTTQPSELSTVGEAEVKIVPINADDHIVGDPNAPVIVVEYSDTECPFCKSFHTTMNRLIGEFSKDGRVAWVYRHFPLWKEENGAQPLHPLAKKEAEALGCATKLGGNTKFWEYTNRIYSVTPSNNGLDPKELPNIAKFVGLDETAFNTCLSSGEFSDKVDAQYEEAKIAGANGTPFSVIVVKKEIDRERVTKTIFELTQKYRSDPSLFSISTDNMRIGMVGAQPYEIVKGLVETLQ